ncbi:MAG TPA: hypothetical protein VLF69_00035 [Candidatus Saccharimonadales bacterium]|nr:hypothetical protein [Candidatus Saccharimonadales bacterium]
MVRAKPKPTKLKKYLTLLIIVLLAAGGLFYYLYHRQHADRSSDQAAKTTTQHNSNQHQATSEGKTFPVPNSVDPGAIKDYTLITENENYKIRELNGAYVITIYAIINNPSEIDDYHQQLHDYKTQALQYLTQHGVNVNKVSITYDPPEAAQY